MQFFKHMFHIHKQVITVQFEAENSVSLRPSFQKRFEDPPSSSTNNFTTARISTCISSNQLILPFFHNLSRLSIVPQFVHPRKHSNPLAVPLNHYTLLILNANERVRIDAPGFIYRRYIRIPIRVSYLSSILFSFSFLFFSFFPFFPPLPPLYFYEERIYRGTFELSGEFNRKEKKKKNGKKGKKETEFYRD